MQVLKKKKDKSLLRAEYIARRRALPPDVAREHAKHIAAQALKCVPEDAHVAAGYVPVLGEVDILPLLMMLEARRVATALPCVEEKATPLVFRAWRPGEALRRGSCSVAEPECSAKVLIPDVLLVPLVAFDRRGHRLGYGGGFYDRTITELREKKLLIRAIGIAYACQEVEELSAAPHDAMLDCIVTEEGVIGTIG